MKAMKRKILNIGNMTGIYALLIIFAFVYIYPLTYAALQSFMAAEDIFNPMVHYVPENFTFDNYLVLINRMNFFGSIAYSMFLSGTTGLISALSCGLMGFALSRFEFKLKKLYIGLLIACLIIPPQVLMIPTFLGYSNLGLIGSEISFFLPALLGQGIKAPIFILICYSYFNTIPKSLDEAAQIDGCSPLATFFRMLLPLAMPALVLVFIFSMVWYWNETYLTTLYIGDSANTLNSNIALVLSTMENEALRDPMMARVNLPVKMASVIISIIPLVVFYLFMQKQFVEGIDRTGITGE